MIKHTGPISGIAAYSNRYVATAGYDNRLVLWDQRTREPLTRAFHDHLVNQCAFNTRGDLLISSSSDYSARIWSVPDLRLLTVLGDHDDDVEMAAFHPSEALVATASRDHRVRIFDLTGRLLHTFVGHGADVISVVWTTGGSEVISSSDDGTVKRWSLATSSLVSDMDLGGVETDTIAMGTDGTIYAGNDEGQILVLNGADRVRTTEAHEAGIKRLVLDCSRMLLASLSYDRSMRLWRVREGGLDLVHETSLMPDVWPRSAAFAADSTIVFATFGASYRTYDFECGRWLAEDVPPTGGINAACASPGGILTVGDAGIVKIINDGDVVVKSRPGSLCNFLTPVGDFIITGGQLGQVFDAATGRVLHEHRSPLNCGASFLNGDAQCVVVGTYTGEGIVIRVRDGVAEHVTDVRLHANAVKGVATSGDLLFSVCADGSAGWYRLPGLEPLAEIPNAHDKIANGCVGLGAGFFASVSRDLKLRIWDPQQRATVLETPHTHSIKCVSASTDGSFIATGSYDGTVAIYDRLRKEWQPMRRLTASGISSLSFDAGRDMFIASSYDGRTYEFMAELKFSCNEFAIEV